MLRNFLAWWLRQLTAALPAAWRLGAGATPADTEDSVILTVVPGTEASIEASRRRRQRLVPLGRFTLDPAGVAALRASLGPGRHGPVRLVLPSGLMLEQVVSFPLPAERGLDSALRWEMDRLTPFTADAVFWAWRVSQRDRVRNQLTVRLMLAAKSAVGWAVDALVAGGLAPSRLEAAGDPARSIALTGSHGGAPRRPVLIAGMILCGAMAIAAAVLPFLRQQAKLDQLETQIAALRPQVDLAEGLRRRVADRAASADVVAAEATRVGDALRILATLTDLLPDDTSLYELSLHDRTVTLTGQSSHAARLIPALAADPAVHNPVLSAAVTRNEMTGAESFSIRAEMKP
ncbi:MAG: PilN domain-containing protein [Acetobacteraceae bacterium]|nr:PilN domain-containing protein [Acetobacteraceae bacterium]